MSNVEMLEIFKSEAIEQLADNDRYIGVLHERIAVLEYHLGRIRESAYQMISSTVGVLPIEYVHDDKPAPKNKKKS
ncbi:MAG: hypothetical protein M0P52_00055 [Rhodoferax sp.]|nr:hypothetical protein [Rhodoferax sp.]